VLLGTSALKEGTVVAVEEGTLQERKKKPTRGNTELDKRRHCNHSPRKGRWVIYH
jgi:hypothetical protein